MKKYRVTFRPPEMPNTGLKVEEIEAEGWRADSDLVLLYRHDGESEVTVFDVPKTNVMRIVEV